MSLELTFPDEKSANGIKESKEQRSSRNGGAENQE